MKYHVLNQQTMNIVCNCIYLLINNIIFNIAFVPIVLSIQPGFAPLQMSQMPVYSVCGRSNTTTFDRDNNIPCIYVIATHPFHYHVLLSHGQAPGSNESDKLVEACALWSRCMDSCSRHRNLWLDLVPLQLCHGMQIIK